MSFENSTLSYVHLVSYPSTWLPGPNTIKLLVLGATEQNLQELTEFVQISWPSQSWAFYHVLDFDITDAAHVDWLIINSSHCDTCVGFATQETHMLMCHIMKAHVFTDSVPDYLTKLFHQSKPPHASMADVLTQALKNLHMETES
jgi:hypothetical protein